MAHLASYAGLAPVTRRSNSSIRNKRPSRRSNPPPLNQTLFLPVFAALKDPISKILPHLQNGPRGTTH
ncbi:transposase [Escherichia coli]